jgi:hypothetical protein
MTEFYAQWFDSPGWMTAKLPEEIIKQLSVEIDKVQLDNFKDAVDVDQTLAGHLSHQVDMAHCKGILNEFTRTMAYEYDRRFNYFMSATKGNPSGNLEISHMWANFQKKHDFNPIHDHSGLMSFVIWHKIPYDLDDELKVYKRNMNSACTSAFEFVYTDSLGNITEKSLPVNKEWEGVICMFPSRLKHCVNPFYTSDEYRISIAGNINLVR